MVTWVACWRCPGGGGLLRHRMAGTGPVPDTPGCRHRFGSPEQVAFLARCVRRLDPVTDAVMPEAAALCSLIIQARRAAGLVVLVVCLGSTGPWST
jgi:hypothetical protein